jgi:hypothetical protein
MPRKSPYINTNRKTEFVPTTKDGKVTGYYETIKRKKDKGTTSKSKQTKKGGSGRQTYRKGGKVKK